MRSLPLGAVDVATGNVLTARRSARLLFAPVRSVDDGDVEIVLPDGRLVTDAGVSRIRAG